MSLLLDALDRAERARREQRSLSHPELSLEPREGETAEATGSGGAAADVATLFQFDESPARPWARRARTLLPWLFLLLLLGAGAGWWWFTSQLPPTGMAAPGFAGPGQPAAAVVPATTVPAPATPPTATSRTPPPSPAANPLHAAAPPGAVMAPPLPISSAARAAPAPDSALRTSAAASDERHLGKAEPRRAGSPQTAEIQAAPSVDVRLFRSAAPTQVDPELVAAWTALRDGRLDTAAQAYGRLEQQQPGNPDVQLGLGRLAAEQGRSDEARRHYRRALDLDPRNAAAAAGLSVLEPAGAGNDIDSQLRTQAAGSDGDAQFALGIRLSAAGQWPEAEQAWFEALRARPGDPDVLCNLAVSLDHLGQIPAARQYYREALQAAGTHPAHFNRPQVEQRLQALGGN